MPRGENAGAGGRRMPERRVRGGGVWVEGAELPSKHRAMCEDKVHQCGDSQPRGHFRAGGEIPRAGKPETKRREDMSEGEGREQGIS